MAHWKSMMDPKDFLYAFDLQGRDVNVQIDRVVAGEVVGEAGRKSKKPKCFFAGKSKPLILNATNCKTIALLTGSNEVEAWAGQWVTLYPTTTQSADGKTVDCIRIRTRAPKPPAANGSGARGRQQQPQPQEDPQASASAPDQEDPQQSDATADAPPENL